MKLSWKEILLIFVLAVFATYLSPAIPFVGHGRCPKHEIPPDVLLSIMLCAKPMGFPLRYYGSCSCQTLLPIAILYFIADVLFYFFLFWLIWAGLKYLLRRR